MSQPVGPPPLSPLSMSSNESTFVGRYGNLSAAPPGAVTPTTDIPYTGGPYGAARPSQTSPPSSQHPSGSTDMSRPSAAGSSLSGTRPPSSASSLGMSSDGRMGFGKPPGRESQTLMRPGGEDALQRHYGALKLYLAVHLQDEKGNIRPNRARDKLLRLSVTQFMELSTDVYDELIRREDERAQRVENVPRFLLPKQNFHPKRNQARQKLSTLPTERFRQLATDVFYELERRIPRLGGGDMGRPKSTTSNASSRSRAASRGGMRPPPGPGGYGFPPPPGTPGAGRGRGFPPPGMVASPRPYSPGPNGMPPPSARRPSEAGSLGRPLPKHLQSNTIVPNKSTMVEDDEGDDDDEDAFGLDHVSVGLSPAAEDKEEMQAQRTEITELKEKVEQLEMQLATKEQELDKGASEEEKNEWTAMREELEQKALDTQKMHDNIEQELAAHKAKSRDEDEGRLQRDRDLETLRDQNEDLRATLVRLETGQHNTASPSEYGQRIQELEEQLARQEKVSNEVREEATTYLREMRDLSRQYEEAAEQEEKMAARIHQLEQENTDWRQRYAKVKAQNKSLRASTMGLGLQTGFDSGSLVRQEGLISEGGLVRDTDVTRFQLAIDELLKCARQTSTENMLESVKSVVISVQSITSAIGTDGYPSPSPSPLSSESNMQPTPSVSKLKARVTGTANSLITATKQHAASHGLSPVALLDAATSNLTASVVELIKAVHIRPSNKSAFQDLEAADELSSFYHDMSPIGEEPHDLQIPVPSSAPPVAVESKTPSSATTELTRKKSNGGWFGWAGKWNGNANGGHEDGQHPHHRQQSATMNGGAAHSDDSDGEFDPYR